MKSPSFLCLLAATVPVVSAIAKPLVAHDVKYVNVPEPRHLSLDVFENLEERIPTINLGTFDLSKRFPAYDPIVAVTLAHSSGNTELSVQLSAVCVGCYLTGRAVVTTTGVDKKQSLLDDVIDWIRDPTEVVINALDLNVKVDLENFGGHFELDIEFGAAGTYTIPLFKPSTPVGVQLNDDAKIGLLFTIDLILKVEAKVTFTTGFDISFPPGTNFVLNPINGNLVSMNLKGAKVNSLPFKFEKGAGCVSATLRVKAQVGVALEVAKKGFDFEAGVFFDPIQYKACVTYQPNSPCQWELTQNFYEEIAAYARAVGDLDFAKWSAGPTAITTFFTGALPSKCLKTSHSTTAKKSKTPEKETPSPTKRPTPAPTPEKQESSTSKKSSSKKHSKTSPHETGPSKSSTKSHKSPSKTPEKPPSSTPNSKSETPHKPHSSTSKKGPTSKSSETGSSSTGKPPSSTKEGETESSGTKKHSSTSHHSFTKTYTGPPYGNHSTTHSETESATSTSYTVSLPTDASSSSSGIILTPSDTDSNSQTTLSPTESTSPGTDITPPSDTVTAPPPSDTSLTTKIIYSTRTFTITSCLSALDWCPTHLRQPVVQTHTIVQYTTVCPVTQTDFPSLPPAAPVPTTTFIEATTTQIFVVVTSPISLVSCETPIIQTFSGYPSYYTENFRPNITGTEPYTVSNASTTIVIPPTPPPAIVTTAPPPLVPLVVPSASSSIVAPPLGNNSTPISAPTPSGTPASVPLGPVIYSIGGFTTPSPDIKALGTPPPPSASATFVQASSGMQSSRLSTFTVFSGSVLAFWLVGF